MAETRTWFMKLNLDELNALAARLWTESDKAAAFQGIVLGCNAGPCPDEVPEVFKRAWEISIAWRQGAENFGDTEHRRAGQRNR